MAGGPAVGPAAAVLPLMHDLPIGFHPGGADAWIWQDLLAKDCTVGAPPDAFNPQGQNWHLPAFVPWKLRAAGYEPFIQTIRAAMRHAAGLRIDHVMGLFRLYWIPQGCSPAQGTYVRYPADDLLGIVALESHRAGAVVVGEDLGTVEPGVRPRLARRNILSVRLLWFEPQPPAEYPYPGHGHGDHARPAHAGRAVDRAGPGRPAVARTRRPTRSGKNCGGITATCSACPPRWPSSASSRPPTACWPMPRRRSCWPRWRMPWRWPSGPTCRARRRQWPNWRLALPGGLEALEAAELPCRIAKILNRPAAAADHVPLRKGDIS